MIQIVEENLVCYCRKLVSRIPCTECKQILLITPFRYIKVSEDHDESEDSEIPLNQFFENSQDKSLGLSYSLDPLLEPLKIWNNQWWLIKDVLASNNTNIYCYHWRRANWFSRLKYKLNEIKKSI
ncbi:MAG: hypothetical protein ACXAC7_09930 [Candidatus Hodarchaeales archaeon]